MDIVRALASRARRRPPASHADCLPTLDRRGSSLIDPLVALTILGLGATAFTGLLLSSAAGARSAAREGRRAAVAQRALDLVRSGRTSADSGVLRAWPGGEGYEAEWARRDDIVPGAIEVSVTSPGGGSALVLGPARPEP